MKDFIRATFVLTAISMLASCGGSPLEGFNQVVARGDIPIQYLGMTKSTSPTIIAYEISLKNITSDTIISFDYTMVRLDDDVYAGLEEKTFGGNFTIAPGEEFSILCRLDVEAKQYVFALKSISWKEASSGALFKWNNPGYPEEVRQLKLKGS